MIGLGSIIGDISGSIYEFGPAVKKENVRLIDSKKVFSQRGFTDDTIHTVATMDWLNDGVLTSEAYAIKLKDWSRKYRNAGYGGMFRQFMASDSIEPYGSFGNGSAMRVSPVVFFSNSISEALDLARKSAEATHNHEEGVKGALAVANAMFMARNGFSKEDIKSMIEETYGYNLDLDFDNIGLAVHQFDATCQVTVPEAIVCFLKSDNYADCIKNAISIGGDTDTIACIAGGIAECYYNVPQIFKSLAWNEYLDNELKDVIVKFNKNCLKNWEK